MIEHPEVRIEDLYAFDPQKAAEFGFRRTQIEILKKLILCGTEKETALQLYVSVNTVKHHVKNILRTTRERGYDVPNKAVLALILVKEGILTLNSNKPHSATYIE